MSKNTHHTEQKANSTIIVCHNVDKDYCTMTKDQIFYLTNHLTDHRKNIKMERDIYNYPNLDKVLELLDQIIKDIEGITND